MIVREEHGDVVLLRLQHGKASALDLELSDEIHAQLEGLRDAGAVVLTGTGGIFSAGVDLLRLLDEGEAYTQRFVPSLNRAFLTLFTFPRPIVAAVNGHAIAGGCVLACGCDHRLMASGRGRIGVPELLVGVPFPVIALETVRFAVPPQHVQEIVYSGTNYSPEDALTRGIVSEVVDPSGLEERAIDQAQAFSQIAPRAFELAKAELRRPAMDFIEKHGEAHDRAVSAEWAKEETRQRIRTYMDGVAAARRK